MCGIGVLFAITGDERAALADAADDDAVVEVVHAIEERWDADWLVETDKAWDPVQRVLDDGNLLYGPSARHEARAILGGTLLTSGDGDDVVIVVERSEVPLVADALRTIDADAFARRHRQLLAGDLSDEDAAADLAYAWETFVEVRALYDKAAAAGRATIFTFGQ